MSQSLKPPRVVFVRPKSAGCIRSHTHASSSFAPASRGIEKKRPTSLAPSISLAGTAPPQPVRPPHNSSRRPSSAVGSRRCVAVASGSLPICAIARGASNLDTLLWQDQELEPETPAGLDTENIYQVVVARKDAENAAQQLARRIAHFRAQEERALCEMQTMRLHLESTLTKTQQPLDLGSADLKSKATSLASRQSNDQAHTAMTLDRTATPDTKQIRESTSQRKRRLRVPRSREQLKFLTKQRRALEVHKLEVARQQKERRKLALAEQKAKEAEQDYRRRCRKERIRAEEQQAIEQRIEKQRQLREAAAKQQFQRLVAEKQRQHKALDLIAEMEEEERNLRLRLEALHFHRDYMKQELRGSLPQHDGI